jgi:hypothetical protein
MTPVWLLGSAHSRCNSAVIATSRCAAGGAACGSRARWVAAVSYPPSKGPWSPRLVHPMAPYLLRGRCPLGATGHHAHRGPSRDRYGLRHQHRSYLGLRHSPQVSKQLSDGPRGCAARLPAGRGSDALGEAGPGLHPASSARGSSIALPHRRGTNAPFDPFCEATSYAAGNGVCSVGSL